MIHSTGGLWLLRCDLIIAGLGGWFWTQRLIGARGGPNGRVGDGLHRWTAPINRYLHARTNAVRRDNAIPAVLRQNRVRLARVFEAVARTRIVAKPPPYRPRHGARWNRSGGQRQPEGRIEPSGARRWGDAGLCRPPHVSMMQATDFGNRHDREHRG